MVVAENAWKLFQKPANPAFVKCPNKWEWQNYRLRAVRYAGVQAATPETIHRLPQIGQSAP